MEISRLFRFIFPALCFSFLTLIPKTQADPTFLLVNCKIQTASNVSRLISYNFTRPPSSSPAGRSSPKILSLCRGDFSPAVCRDCVAFAYEDAHKQCPKSTGVTIWYNECMLRYPGQSIPSVSDNSYEGILISPKNVTDTNGFNQVLGKVMDDIATRASSGDSVLKFAVGDSNLSAHQKLYGLAQCMPDLNNTDCHSCLLSCISYFPTCCNGRRGAGVLTPSCNVRYEMYQFYNATAVPISPPPPPVLSPPPPPPPPSTTTSSPGSIGKKIAIGVSVSVFVVVTLLGLGIYSKRRGEEQKKKRKKLTVKLNYLNLHKKDLVMTTLPRIWKERGTQDQKNFHQSN